MFEDICIAPSVAILGLGGCGVNLVRKIVNDKTKSLINFANLIDCSTANKYNDEHVYVIANEVGGGKVRETNLQAMKAKIPQLDETILGDEDVYILVTSLAGATGGVMLPLMMKELLARGKKVIVAAISEAIDQKGTTNTRSALKVLMTLVDKSNLYLPMVLAHTDRNRNIADNFIIDQVTNIVKVLRQPCYEVDKTDRLNWLDPSKTIGASGGIHAIYGVTNNSDYSALEDFSDKHLIIDSALNLGVQEEEDGSREYVKLSDSFSRFSKDGILMDSDEAISGVITSSACLLEDVLTKLTAKHRLYSTPVEIDNSLETMVSKLGDLDEDADDFL